MSTALDTHTWKSGSQDGEQEKPLRLCPCAPERTENREPRRAGPGSPTTLRAKAPDTITRPADPYRDPLADLS